MRHLSVTLALLLALVALPAWGATYWVRQDSTDAAHHSGADSANCAPISTINAKAAPGDVILLLGNFTTSFIPVQSGTGYAPANVITYQSAYNDPKSVTLNNSLVADGTGADSFVVWRAVTIRDGVHLGGSATTAHWQLRNSVISNGYLQVTKVSSSRMDSLTITRTTWSASPSLITFEPSGNDTSGACYKDTLTYTTATATGVTGTTGIALNRWSGYDNVYDHVRVSVTTDNAADYSIRFSRVNNTVRGIMRDCYFYGLNLMPNGGTNEPMGWGFKDGVKLFKMYRDTIIVAGNTQSAGTTWPIINFAQNETDGVAANVGQEIGGNVLRNCYFSNQTPSNNYAFGWIYGGFDGDSLVGNTFVGRSAGVTFNYGGYPGAGFISDQVMATSTPTIVDHNAFVTFASGTQALAFYPSSEASMLTNTKVRFTNNIFTNMAATTSPRAVRWGTSVAWAVAPDTTGPIDNDYNLVYVPNSSARDQVCYSATVGGALIPSAINAAPWSVLRVVPQDTHSAYGGCIFTDSSYTGFDAHPKAGSAALTIGSLDASGYVGPFGSGVGTYYTLTVTAGAHGSVSPGSVSVPSGATQQFNINPDACYGIVSVTVDGVVQDPNNYQNNQYVFTNVTDNHTISVVFGATLYHITSSAGANGTVTPASADYGCSTSQTFTITANGGYGIANVLVDGASVGVVSSYAFTNIVTNHTISATFASTATHAISVSAGVGGSISPAGTGGVVSVADGASQTFAISANSGYTIADVLADGVSQGAVTSYQFTNVTGNHSISASFNANGVTVYASGGTNGQVSGGGTISSGGTLPTVSAHPDKGYRTASMIVDGVDLGPTTDYTFKSVRSDHSVYVTFAPCLVKAWASRRQAR